MTKFTQRRLFFEKIVHLHEQELWIYDRTPQRTREYRIPYTDLGTQRILCTDGRALPLEWGLLVASVLFGSFTIYSYSINADLYLPLAFSLLTVFALGLRGIVHYRVPPRRLYLTGGEEVIDFFYPMSEISRVEQFLEVLWERLRAAHLRTLEDTKSQGTAEVRSYLSWMRQQALVSDEEEAELLERLVPKQPIGFWR